MKGKALPVGKACMHNMKYECGFNATVPRNQAPFNNSLSFKRLIPQHATVASRYQNQAAFSLLFVAGLEILDAAVWVLDKSTGASS